MISRHHFKRSYHLSDDTEISVGTEATYKCKSGYQLVGEKSLTCLENQSWSADLPVCQSKSILQDYENICCCTKFKLDIFLLLFVTNDFYTWTNKTRWINKDVEHFISKTAMKQLYIQECGAPLWSHLPMALWWELVNNLVILSGRMMNSWSVNLLYI